MEESRVAIILKQQDGAYSAGEKATGLCKLERVGTQLKAEISAQYLRSIGGKYLAVMYFPEGTFVLGELTHTGKKQYKQDYVVDSARIGPEIGVGIIANENGQSSIALAGHRGHGREWLDAIHDVVWNLKAARAAASAPAQTPVLEELPVETAPPDTREDYPDETSENIVDTAPPRVECLTYYERNRAELEAIFDSGTPVENLELMIPGSRWSWVDAQGESQAYVMGIITEDEKPLYICYGVPAEQDAVPPAGMAGYCQWLPQDMDQPHGLGFWMMYQDALTGHTVEP